MAVAPESGSFGLRNLVVPLYIPSFLVYLSQGLITSFIVLYASELGAGPAGAGVIAALPYLGTLFFDLPAGRMIDRFKLKTVYGVGTLIIGVMCILMGAFGNLIILMPLLIVYGGGRTAWAISQVAVVRKMVAPDILGRALANVGGLVRLGTFIGPVAGGYIAAAFGLGSTFIVSGALALCAAVLMYIFLQEPQIKNGSPPLDKPRKALESFHRYRGILLTAGAGIVALGVLRSSRSVLLPLYGEHLGLSLGQIGLVMGISGLADTVLFFPAGMVYDRWGINTGAMLCLGIFSFGIMLVSFSLGFVTLLIIGVIIGIGNGFGAGVNMALSAVLAPDGEVGEFMGMWRLFTDAGVFAGPLVVGFITAAAGLTFAPPALAIIGASGALVFRRIGKPGAKNL